MRSPGLRALAILIVVAAIGWSISQPPTQESRHYGTAPNLVLISVDTLRYDHLSIYGYDRPTSPQIDAFFADGEIYERAYSAETNTPPSVVSLLTGLYPPGHGIRLFLQRIDDDVTTLADVLAAAGYQTAAVVSNSVLASESIGLDRRFDHYDDTVTEREGIRPVWERRAGPTTDAAIGWLSQARNVAAPYFLWVHYNDPHGPYDPPAETPADFAHEGEQIVPRRKIPAYIQLAENPQDALEYIDRYDEEISYLDQEVGRLLSEVQRSPGDTIVALTADHGETMVEHETYFSHGYHVWEPLVRVPLLVRRPGGRGRRIQAPVSGVDLAPSLLAYIGVSGFERSDGFVFGTRPPNVPIVLEAFANRSQVRAFVVGNQKWFIRVDGDREIIDRTYLELGAAAEEWRTNRWRAHPAADALEHSARTDPDPGGIPKEYAKGVQLAGPKVAPSRDARQTEALRALGYVE